MKKKVIPSEMEVITGTEIARLCKILSPVLLESGLLKDPFGRILEHRGSGLAADIVTLIRDHMDSISDLLVRRVRVNRDRDAIAALTATGRRMLVNSSVVASIPRGKGPLEQDVYFIRVDHRDLSDIDADKIYKMHGLRPADLYELAAVSEADPPFADKYKYGSHWKDADGNWCFGTFFTRLRVDRRVVVDRLARYWSPGWLLAGVREEVN